MVSFLDSYIFSVFEVMDKCSRLYERRDCYHEGVQQDEQSSRTSKDLAKDGFRTKAHSKKDPVKENSNGSFDTAATSVGAESA